MMNFEQVVSKLSTRGYRKSGALIKDGFNIYDYSHNKRLGMFSVYVNNLGSVEYVEQSKIAWDNKERRNVIKTTKITGIKELSSVLA